LGKETCLHRSTWWLNGDAVQVTYGGTVPTDTNENSMTNACHVGLAIPCVNFWQTSSWHMGQLGHLGRHFLKESPNFNAMPRTSIKSSPRITQKKISRPRRMVMFSDCPKATN